MFWNRARNIATLASGLRISQKLPLAVVAAAVLSAAGVGISSFLNAESEIRREASEKLQALMEVRRNALSDYLSSIQQDLRIVASNETAQRALADFTSGWQALGSNQTETLQELYIHNDLDLGKKDELDFANDGSAYSEIHGRYHPWFRTFLRERGYYDIFLFDLDGNLIYTVFKELDYATNLNSGEWRDTDLGNAFRAARDNPQAGAQTFFDFKPYEPSHGAPASFISTPMHDQSGRLAGVLVFQMPIDNMNAVMQNSAGLGETGEAFIVGADHLMRSDSRFSEETTILQRSVNTTPVALALDNQTGTIEAEDHLGQEVLAAYGPLEFLGTRWALVAESASDEIFRGIATMRRDAIIYTLLSLAIVCALGIYFARSVSRPITDMVEAMRQLAAGNKDVPVPALERGDEIGEMAQTVQVFKETAVEADRMAAEKVEQERRAEQESRQATLSLADSLEDSIKGIVDNMTKSVEQMVSVSKSLISTSDQTAAQASSVVAKSEETSSTVQTVATAADELSGSIDDIRRQVNDASGNVLATVNKVKESNATVQELAEGAQKIGHVVALINDIAEQTNLLALNATIEAARAGEAGKGFAVVASEVKALANQTAKATEEISAQIDSMQVKTSETVKAIEGVEKGIGSISEFTTNITNAVEQQTAATGDIARNVQGAAAATQGATQSVQGVSQAASESGTAAKQVHDAFNDLAGQATLLNDEMTQFLAKLRAA